MCGRYASTRSRTDLADLYGATRVEGEDRGAQYNIAPTTSIYAVLDHADKNHPDQVERELRTVRWGLLPPWSKGPKNGPPLINARVETAASKPSWRVAYRRRRAAIPASGYYEWVDETGDGGRAIKQPYYLHPPGASGLHFAGLYELWPDPTKDEADPDRWVWSAAIITCAATGPAGEVHDRTPVILPSERIDAWLDPRRTNPDEVAEVLQDIQPPLLGIRAVSREVNRVGTNGAHLIEPLAATTPDATIQLELAS